MNDPFTFLETDNLKNEEICLLVKSLNPADDEKGFAPSYIFDIHNAVTGEQMGGISLRVGCNENLYYGGHIGYGINPEFRGKRYAGKACALLFDLARRHGMKELIITCNPDNIASRRTCEIAGCKLSEIVDLPPHNDMYREGERQKCIYRFEL